MIIMSLDSCCRKLMMVYKHGQPRLVYNLTRFVGHTQG